MDRMEEVSTAQMGFARDVLASGVMGIFDYDVYLPPMGWQTSDYLYFNRETPDGTTLYRTDGTTIAPAGLTNDFEYRFLREFDGDAYLIGTGPESDVLVRENTSGSVELETPPGLEIGYVPPFQIGDRFGFTAVSERANVYSLRWRDDRNDRLRSRLARNPDTICGWRFLVLQGTVG